MIGKAMQMYAGDLGFTVNEKCAYGVFKNYLITLYDTISKKTAFVNYFLDDTEESDVMKYKLSEFIKENLTEYQIEDYEVEDNGVSIVIKENLVKLSEFLPLLTDKLSETGMKGYDYCSECGAEITGTAKKAAVSLKRYTLCSSCALELIEKVNNKKNHEAEDDSGKKSFGVLGAVLAGLVSLLVWIVLYSFELFGEGNNIIIAFILAFLTPLLVFKAYDLLNGARTKARGITITVVTLFVVVLGVYFGSFLQFLISNSYKISAILDFTNWSIPFETSGDGFFSNAFYKELLVSALSSAISALIFVSNIFKSNSSSSKIELD